MVAVVAWGARWDEFATGAVFPFDVRFVSSCGWPVVDGGGGVAAPFTVRVVGEEVCAVVSVEGVGVAGGGALACVWLACPCGCVCRAWFQVGAACGGAACYRFVWHCCLRLRVWQSRIRVLGVTAFACLTG